MLHERRLRTYISLMLEAQQVKALPAKLVSALRSHLVNDWALPPAQVRALRQILADRSIPRLVHEPPQQRVFRGMTVTKAWVTELARRRTDSMAGSMTLDDAVFGRTDQATSWSISKKRAQDYFYVDARQGLLNVVLSARIDQNPDTFVACASGLYRVPELSGMRKDKEAIALGPVKRETLEWSDHGEWFEKMKNSFD